MTVTDAEGAQVKTIDGRPAWDVWRERTRDVAKTRGIDVDALKPDEIGRTSSGTRPASRSADARRGLQDPRAPLAVGDDGSLSFACGIPTGAVIRITGEPRAPGN